MSEYFGTTNNIIDWDPIVDICKKCTTGDVNTPVV